MERDHVDELIGQWRAVRPDLELAPMATFGHLGRLHAHATRAIEAVFERHGLSMGAFDVLAALRRAGEPHVMTPTALSRLLMLSPAGMTNRVDRLEATRLVGRRPDPEDRRSFLVVLTEAGRELADGAVTEHVANAADLLAASRRRSGARSTSSSASSWPCWRWNTREPERAPPRPSAVRSARGRWRDDRPSSDVTSPWRRRLDREPDRWPVLPLRPGIASNGEYLPPPRTAADRRLERSALDRVATAAKTAGMDRRRFLQTSAGVAAVLATYNAAACADGGGDRSAPRSSTTGSPGGTFDVPPAEDVEACRQALGGSEFIFDIHTHHVVPEGPWRQNAQRIADMIQDLVPPGCAEADPFRCVDRTAYLHDMFLASDTTVSMLSDVPNSGPLDAPVPWAEKRETKALADSLALGGRSRVLLHDVLAPNFGDLTMRLDEMEANAATGDLSAFKVYTAWGPGGRGFALDDPAIGLPVVGKAQELGVRILCAHKGLPLLEFDREHNGPNDIVAVAKQFPEMDFIVYHGAYEIQTTEGPYDPGDAATGVNSLVKAMDDHGIPPNANVHAELGTTWRETLSSPTEAAHVLGKLLTRVGVDNVMWGTDAVWYGSPQPQIMAFRAFQIAPELQERHGYPALTPELKAKVFGLNAARVFGVDPALEERCGLDPDGLAEARARLAGYHEDGVAVPWQARGPLTRREVLLWLRNLREPWTPV